MYFIPLMAMGRGGLELILWCEEWYILDIPQLSATLTPHLRLQSLVAPNGTKQKMMIE